MGWLTHLGIGVALVVGSLSVETTVLTLGRAAPDLVLAVVLAYGLARGSMAGTLVGFFGGLAEGLLFGGAIGLAALLKTIAGYTAGIFAKNVRTEGLSLSLATAFVSCLIYQLVYGTLLFVLGYPVDESRFLGAMIWQPALATTVFFVPVFMLLRSRSHETPRGVRL